MSLEEHFDPIFTARLGLREKQIQQNYRPIIGVHKWFARRPGTVFRNLLLAEFNGSEPASTSYWHAHKLEGTIADPFMGGGTPIFEASRLGFAVVGTDINPMAYWIVHQSLNRLDLVAFVATADQVVADVGRELGELYTTHCVQCSQLATVKYFLWVKTDACPTCGDENDLFPGYLLAEATRHPKHVLVCAGCGALNEFDRQPTRTDPAQCAQCGQAIHREGVARRRQVSCRSCGTRYSYLRTERESPPEHRMWALEYYCEWCKPHHRGRFFKQPDADDRARFMQACSRLAQIPDLPIPDDAIPAGDETDRLHRWGYRRYRELFNERQLLGLGLLLQRINQVADVPIRHALLTVFSDFLRYQNMLCRYDTYALKCQDIFSVHGFPVGLVQCENNLLGIPRIGSGAFRHFVEKYLRAKQYCEAPFETRMNGRRKEVVPITGERIDAEIVEDFPECLSRQAYLRASPATDVPLPIASLDGVFTDPPYFDNVQYAELMDFCFVWLRLGLQGEISAFQRTTTRTLAELTGNVTLGRGLEHFTAGLSEVFRHYAAALKPGAPFVFTYHHNEPTAYVPLIVAILDAGMDCTATHPVPAEMSASLHIAGTASSILDSVFVCRNGPTRRSVEAIDAAFEDARAMESAGLCVRAGDLRCLLAGHLARITINQLYGSWDAGAPLSERVERARTCLTLNTRAFPQEALIAQMLTARTNLEEAGEARAESL